MSLLRQVLPAPIPLRRRRRRNDQRTSVIAAQAANKASWVAIELVEDLMADNADRTDQEIHADLIKSGVTKATKDTLSHARQALSEADILVDTGVTRLTKAKRPSIVWGLKKNHPGAVNKDPDLSRARVAQLTHWIRKALQDPRIDFKCTHGPGQSCWVCEAKMAEGV